MTDPLDDLKSALTEATPAPNAQRRAETLALAQKNFADLQGSPDSSRPTSRPQIWTRINAMLTGLTSRGGLTLTTTVVACGVFIATPMGRDLFTPPRPALERAENLSPATLPLSPSADRALEAEPEAALPAARRTAPVRINDAQAEMVQSAPLRQPLSPFPAEPVARRADSTETFANAAPNPLRITAEHPVSTFSIDVDTAAYSFVRQSLRAGQLPPRDAVRVEEMINYFPYDYPAPDGAHPFEPTVSVFETPWNADTQLVHIGIQGALPLTEDRPPLNLVFLIDTSGSMDAPNKLPLLRQSFRLMLSQLRAEDEVAIVTYAGSSTVALPPTPARDRTTIEAALTALTAGGSTNGEGGLEQAYALAEDMTQAGEIARVILATDGDFNLGLSDPRGLEGYIADKRQSGTYLSVLGFGRGNLQDAVMQSLAQNGNGTAAYIDTLAEAQKALVDHLAGALFPLANDVKIQVEFNPATVAEYRLIGYESRALTRTDFNNDAVDAGDLGAGHTVTAIYEITPQGSPAQLSDPLRYQSAPDTNTRDELGILRLRYKAPGAETSQLIETPFQTLGTPGTDAAFSAAIAGFGQLLRDPGALNGWTIEDAITLAQANRGSDPFGYRTEAVQLMRLARALSN